jgi:hypothetical protein
MGKTTMLRSLLRDSSRALAFDPLAVMSREGLVIRRSPDLIRWLDRHAQSPRFRVIYQPQVEESDFEAIAAEVNLFCFLGRKLENIDLFFDEIDSFSNSESMPDELRALIDYGRKHNVSQFGSVRRPRVKIPKDWVAATTRFIIFRTCDQNDAGFLSGFTGIDKEEIMNLAPFEYFSWLEGDVKKAIMANPYK